MSAADESRAATSTGCRDDQHRSGRARRQSARGGRNRHRIVVCHLRGRQRRESGHCLGPIRRADRHARRARGRRLRPGAPRRSRSRRHRHRVGRPPRIHSLRGGPHRGRRGDRAEPDRLRAGGHPHHRRGPGALRGQAHQARRRSVHSRASGRRPRCAVRCQQAAWRFRILNATPEAIGARPFLDRIDALIVNETEAEDLLGYPVSADNGEEAARALSQLGPGTVAVTLGASGVAIVHRGEAATYPAPRVEVVDTTGAGDAFCGAFAAELARDSDPFTAARTGVVAGSLATTIPGAYPGIPRRDAIYQLLTPA